MAKACLTERMIIRTEVKLLVIVIRFVLMEG
jgi:hypothetical protein